MKQRGFTLIEIAIGMAVLGIGVATALQTFGGALQLARGGARRTEGVMHAKALMDSTMWAPELAHQVSHGEIGDGYRWERTIERAGPIEGPDGEPRADVRLSIITVVVEWDEPTGIKNYGLKTMRVEPNYDE